MAKRTFGDIGQCVAAMLLGAASVAAQALTNVALTPKGVVVVSPGSYNASYPVSRLTDGLTAASWIGPNGTYNNLVGFQFDPNTSGVTGAGGDTKDYFALDNVTITGDGSTSMVRQFMLQTEQAATPGVWSTLVSGSGAVSGYNFALTAQGGRVTNSPGSYNASYPLQYLTDGTSNTQWIAPNNTYRNTIDLAFDPNLNGTTGLLGDAFDPFTLTGVAITGDGGTSMVRQFGLYAQTTAAPGVWQPFFAATGSVSGYNFAMTAQGGVVTNTPGAYNASYPISYLTDGTTNTQWIAPNNTYKNTIDLAFDPNLNGTTALAGDVADRFALSGVAISGDNSTAMLKNFTLFAQTSASPGVWAPLFAASGAVTGYNFAMSAQGGAVTNAPGSYNASYPLTNLTDGTSNTQWIAPNNTYSNTIDLAFDPSLDGTSGLAGDSADRFTLTQIGITGDASTAMVKQFNLFAQTSASPGVWQQIYNGSGTVSGYNFAMTAQGGKVTNAPGSYNASYPLAYLNDGTSNTQWIAPNNTYSNTIDFAFDPSLNGIYSETGDWFAFTGLALTGDGSTSMLKQFTLFTQQSGSGTWQQVFAGTGAVTGYNFAMAAQGGKVTNAPGSYNASYPLAYLNDATSNTQWIAPNNTYKNTIDLAFDPNLNGTTGELADQFTLTGVAVTGDGSTAMLRQFTLFAQQSGSGTWQPLYAATGAVSNYNFGLTAQGGRVSNAPGSYNASYPISYLTDGTSNTQWIAPNGVMSNTIDMAFDPNLNGATAEVADQFTLTGIAITGDGSTSMVRQFNAYAQQAGSSTWVQLSTGSPASNTFTVTRNASRQLFALSAALPNVTAVRLVTLNNNGQSYLSINELEIVGDGTANQPLFTKLQNSANQVFNPIAAMTNVTAVRMVTVNNYGQSYLSINELQVLGDGAANQPLFTTSQSNARQVFTLSSAVPNVSAVRMVTVNNFGQSYLSLNELEILGDGTAAQPNFTALQNATQQLFTLATPIPNVTAVRVKTINNYGQSYLSINELEVLGNGAANQPLFKKDKDNARQVFPLATPLADVTAVRMVTINNYGQSYLSINELEVLGNGSANQPLFTAAQSSARQTFTTSTLADVTAVRVVTINNYGQSYLSMNELEVLGSGNANQPLFTAARNGVKQIFYLSTPPNAGLLTDVIGLRLITVNNYGQSYLSINEFEVWGDVASTVGSFNAFEAGTAATAGGVIRTKISGAAFALDVVALTAAPVGLATTFTGDVVVELVDNASSAVCASKSVIGSPLTSTFTGADAGRKSVTLMHANSWPDARVRMSYLGSTPAIVSCSVDNFAIRPASFSLVVSDTDWASSGTARVLDNVSVSGGKVHKAGSPFTITVNAYNAATPPAVTTNYANQSIISIASYLTPASCTSCQLTTGTFSGSAGSYATSSAAYNEVGTLALQAIDTTFAAVDATDSSTAERYITSGAVNVGRFVPDHFDVSVQQQGALQPACGAAFTYTGQAMSYAAAGLPRLTILPMNAASGGAVTQNYQGSLQKLAASGITLQSPTADTTRMGKDGVTKVAIASTTSTGDLTNVSGTMTYTLKSTDSFTYLRDSNSLVAPFTSAVALRVTAVAEPSGSDGVAAAGSLPTLAPTGANIRYGRVRLNNAYGSERLDLPMTMRAEYWSNAGWMPNTVDTCTGDTSVTAANAISLSVSAPALACVWDNLGRSGAGCSPALPVSGAGRQFRIGSAMVVGPGNLQPGDFNLWLHPISGLVGKTSVSANVPLWLQYNWTGSVLSNPVGQATFGIYKSPLIYRRENY